MTDPLLPLSSGVFLSFEGIDGSGKSTQAQLLVEALRSLGHRVVSVREPGGTQLGESVRALLLDAAATVSPRAEALLFSAARAQLVADVIEPALHRGDIVVADRFVDSTEAYQGGGRALQTGLEAVSAFATAGRMPTRTYLVHIPLDVARARRTRRSDERSEADRIEAEGEGLQSRVAAAYEGLSTRAPDRVLIVKGDRLPEEIHAEILSDALKEIDRASSDELL